MKGIYKITNKINGHCYIGQSICIENRWKDHRIAAFNTNDPSYNYPLYRAFRKYGINNFTWEVLEQVENASLDEKEIHYISLYNSFENGYNQTPGGSSGGGGRVLSPTQVKEIQDKLITQKYTLTQLSIEYNVHKDTIRDINNGTTWNYLNPNLKYPLYISMASPLYHKKQNHCLKCGVEISYGAQYCINCFCPTVKGNYPQKEQIIVDITNLGFVGAGKKYNVSDNALRKHCKKLGLSTYIKDYKQAVSKRETILLNSGPQRVGQYDLNGDYIQSFNSYADAARWIYDNGFCKTLNSGVRGHIGDAAKGKRKSAYKFLWKDE